MDPSDVDSVAEHEQYMRRCLELARVAQSRNNTPVGSIVVIDGKIVGEGIESLPAGSDVTGHAEVLACQAAVNTTGKRQLDGAAIYTTAEPCFMCSYIIRQCGVSLVVFGQDTPGVGGVTSPLPILTDARLVDWRPPPRVVAGILRNECELLLSASAVRRRERQ